MKGAKGADVFETMLAAFEDDSEVLGQQTQQQPDDKAADAWKTGGGILLSALQKGEQPPVCLAGRYHLIEQIGRGGMGEVWKAWDEREERLIALKQLHMRSSQDVRSQQRFARESRLLQSLKHKHIVELFDVAANDRFYTMELLEGWTLREYLRLRKRLTLFETIYILQQVTEGLFAAHHKGLIHRDLKPENIFLCADTSEHVTFMPVGMHDAPTAHSFASCQVKLLDFGIATMMDGTRLTSREGLVGTAYYISPEQMRGKKVTKAADLYSLGIILYEMLTGEVPVIGAPSIEASFSKREESKLLMPWECPSETKDTYHQHIEHIQALFSKLIRREPNERIALSHVSYALKTCEADLLKERQAGAKARVKRLKELRLKASHARFWTQLQKAEEAYPEKRNFQVLREEMKAIFAQVDEYARVLAEKLATESIEDCRVFWNEVCQREDLAGFCEGHSQAQSLARQERALMKRIRAVEHKLREDGPLACLTWIREDEFQSRQWMALCGRVQTLADVYEARTEALLRTDPILDAESVCDDWEHIIADDPDIRDFCLRHPHYLKARKQLSSKNERYRRALQLAEEGELEEALGQLQTLQLSLTSHEQAGEYGALLRRVEDAWETFQKDLVDTRRLLDDFATYTATTHWERCLQRATFPKAYEKLWDAIRHDELDDEPHTQMPPTSSQTSGRWRVFGASVFIVASALFGWFGAMYMRNTDVFLHERAQRVASKAKGSSFDRLLVMLHRQHPQKVRRMIEKLVTSDESTTPLRVKTPGGKKGRRLSSHLLALRLFVGLKHKKVLF
ncbi:MAG TPA: hypothetical protein DCE42_10230, partial [Myxococcales bacterium]|nr:hypothetical protein [Myxococcales bacterium]